MSDHQRANLPARAASDGDTGWHGGVSEDVETLAALAADAPQARGSGREGPAGAGVSASDAVMEWRHTVPPATAATVATPPPDDAPEVERAFITGRMAQLTRDPQYARAQRRIANRRRSRARLTDLLVVLDLGLTLAALALAHWAPSLLLPRLPWHLSDTPPTQAEFMPFVGAVLVIWPTVFTLLGLYNGSWLSRRMAPWRVVAAVVVAGVVAGCGLYFIAAAELRVFLLTFLGLDAALLVGVRMLLLPVAAHPRFCRRVLIVGTGRLALDTARAVVDRRVRGLRLVGLVGPEGELATASRLGNERKTALYRALGVWRRGNIEDVPRLVSTAEVDLVLIALSARERDTTSWIISSLAHQPIQLYVVPNVVEETARTATDVIDGLPLVGLTEPAIQGWIARVKRGMDLALCLPAVVLLMPLMFVIAVAIRLDSRGPAIFKQERVGQHNRRFTIFKFRTMYLDAEWRAREVAVRTEAGLIHKRRRDPRVTRFGAILRRMSLDELPQLVNVLKGDMSLVGPRPELPWIVEDYRAWQYRRLLVPQGITGWWQVHGRSERVMHLHTQDDIFYVRNYSLRLDLKILLMTVIAVIRGRGAF